MSRAKKRGSSMRGRAKARAQERKNTGGGGTKFQNMPTGVSFFQAKKGTMKFDIIPYEITVDNHPSGIEKGDIWYQRTIDVHYGVGPEEKTYLCRKTIGGRCPICEYAAQLRKSGEADDETLASLKARERELYNVIDLDNKDEGVQLFEMSYYLFGKLLEEELREGDDDLEGFAMPDEGMTLRVRFSEKSMGKNTFLETSRIDFIPRKKQYDDSIIDKAVNLDEILNILSYEDLQAVFMGEDASSTTDDEPANNRNNRRNKQDDDDGDEGDKDQDTGVDEGEEQEEEQKSEPEKPKGAPKNKPKDKPKDEGAGDGSCPHGGNFGVDTDDLEFCDTCEVWESCIETKEANE